MSYHVDNDRIRVTFYSSYKLNFYAQDD